jgi:uncharacterized OB-fold protein
VCAQCHGFDIDWESVEAAGTIYSWSRSWYPYISELGGDLPYISVLVELPHAGGRRVLGMLVDDPQRTPKIGDRVVGTVRTRPGEPWPLLRWTREEVAA